MTSTAACMKEHNEPPSCHERVDRGSVCLAEDVHDYIKPRRPPPCLKQVDLGHTSTSTGVCAAIYCKTVWASIYLPGTVVSFVTHKSSVSRLFPGATTYQCKCNSHQPPKTFKWWFFGQCSLPPLDIIDIGCCLTWGCLQQAEHESNWIAYFATHYIARIHFNSLSFLFCFKG